MPDAPSATPSPEAEAHDPLRTRLVELLGCQHPIVQTGMGWVSGAHLTAATSAAGGFGILASITMTAVGDAAYEMIHEIRRQFHEIPGLLEGTGTPDTARCVDIATSAALQKMVLPGVIAVAAPVVIGFGGVMPNRWQWLDGDSLHWVIVGGESGPLARQFDLSWSYSIILQCRKAGVPVFVKQLGSRPTSVPWGYTITGKGGDWNEWPADLRIREYPPS